jgi:tetratricopeptide (TPR) repeat protein
MLVLVLVLAAILMGGMAVVFVVLNKAPKEVKSLMEEAAPGRQPKTNDTVLFEAAKRLEKNPKDVSALLACGEIYFKNNEWNKTYNVYEALCSMAGAPGVNDCEVNYRCALAAEKLGNINGAYKAYLVASTFDESNYLPLLGLGSIEFQRGNFEKATAHLAKARNLNPENAPTLVLLGHSYFKLKKYKEAVVNIRQALELVPGDKDALFTLAECYGEVGQADQALRIYSHLRADPNHGPMACLKSGEAHLLSNQLDDAITDFEIGLKHEKMDADVAIELKYKAGVVAVKKNDIPKAVDFFSQVMLDKPDGYKDTAALLGQYAELNANQNLQIYLTSQPAEFLALCRKIVMTYYPRSHVKITSTSVEGKDWADIVAEIDTAKWSDIIGFRFVRTQGAIGELVVRDFHAHLKDLKAGKGICFGIGTFSDEARRFTEARLIELVEKARLVPLLSNVSRLAQELMGAKR